MKQSKTVMACIDLSEYSPMTLAYAAGLAKGGKLVVCSVVHQRDVQPVYIAELASPFQVDTEEQTAYLLAERKKEVNALVAKTVGKRDVRVHIDTGHPADKILMAVESLAPDLVVMANKGRSNLSRFMFGSAAERVFRNCQAPLLSVRDKAIFRRRRPGGGAQPSAQPIQTIMAAVDFSYWTDDVLAQTAWLARVTGAKVKVFNCINQEEVDWVETHFTPAERFSRSRFVADEKSKRKRHLMEKLQASALGKVTPAEIVMDFGVPFKRILKAVDDLGADVLVMGPRGRSRTDRFRFGSTVEKVFRHCPVPVLRLGPEFNSVKE